MTQDMQHIYENKGSNVFKTWLFLILFALMISAVGFILAGYFNNPVFLYSGFFLAIGMNVWSYWFSDKMVLKMAGAVQVDEVYNKDLFNSVARLSSQAGLPMPKVYIINDPSPNAFATGRNHSNSAVAYTTGILALLSKEELEGVTAHELSHILNRDTLLMTIVAVMASFISLAANMAMSFGGGDSENRNIFVTIAAFVVIIVLLPLAATVIQLAISRKREFLADATGAGITRLPENLANALVKISNFPIGMQNVNPNISHLFISNPEKLDAADHGDSSENRQNKHWFSGLFMTHPPVEERVKALIG